MTDEQLAVRAAAGDQLAFEALSVRFRPMLRFHSRSLYAAGEEREDFDQAALVGLFEACRDFRTDRGANFRTFANQVVGRLVIDHAKARTRLKHGPLSRALSLDAPMLGAEDEGATTFGEGLDGKTLEPGDVLEQRDELRRLVAAIRGGLSRLEREALVGFVFNGESYAEVEARLETNAKTVDNALQRAKRKVADAVGVDRFPLGAAA